MKPICITDTENSPAIFLDLESGRLIITGLSVMADPRITYMKLIRIIRKNAFPHNMAAHASILLQETNTQSLLFLLEVLRLLKNVSDGNSIVIDWLYPSNDTDLKEKIEIFEEILSTKINGVAYVHLNWKHGGNPRKAFSILNSEI